MHGLQAEVQAECHIRDIREGFRISVYQPRDVCVMRAVRTGMSGLECKECAGEYP